MGGMQKDTLGALWGTLYPLVRAGRQGHGSSGAQVQGDDEGGGDRQEEKWREAKNRSMGGKVPIKYLRISKG